MWVWTGGPCLHRGRSPLGVPGTWSPARLGAPSMGKVSPAALLTNGLGDTAGGEAGVRAKCKAWRAVRTPFQISCIEVTMYWEETQDFM